MNEHAREVSAAHELAIDVDAGEAGFVVAVSGEIDIANIDLFRSALQYASGEADVVIADLSDATYIDSSTIELMMVTSRELRSKRGEFRVVAALESRARRVLAISGVERELLIYETRAGAMEAGDPTVRT
jgi:anti-anti-sigma factor